MLITRPENYTYSSDFKTRIPISTICCYKPNTGNSQYLSARPRLQIVTHGPFDYTDRATGKNQHFNFWPCFPNWRRNALTIGVYHSEIDSTGSQYSGHFSEFPIGLWQTGSSFGPLFGNVTWGTLECIILMDSWGNVSTDNMFVKLYPKNILAGISVDEDYKANLERDLGEPINPRRDDMRLHPRNYAYLINDDFFPVERQQYSYKPTCLFPNDEDYKKNDFNKSPYACWLDGSKISPVLENQAQIDYRPYWPEWQIIWSTDRAINPAAFCCGVDCIDLTDSQKRPASFSLDDILKARQNTTSSEKSMMIRYTNSEAKSTTFHYEYYKTTNYTAQSRKIQNRWPILNPYQANYTQSKVTNSANDKRGSDIVYLGQYQGRYWYLGYCTMNSSPNTGVPSSQNEFRTHLTGGMLSANFHQEVSFYPLRSSIKQSFITFPYVGFEMVANDSTPLLSGMPTFMPQNTQVRIHEWSLGFWGGLTSNYDSYWTSFSNGFKAKQFQDT